MAKQIAMVEMVKNRVTGGMFLIASAGELTMTGLWCLVSGVYICGVCWQRSRIEFNMSKGTELHKIYVGSVFILFYFIFFAAHLIKRYSMGRSRIVCICPFGWVGGIEYVYLESF